MQKSETRNSMLRVRAQIEHRAEKDKRIQDAACALAADYSRVFCYVSMGSEVSTRDIVHVLRLEGKTVYVPYTLPNKTMHAVCVDADTPLVPNNRGNILSYADTFFDGQAELIFVPLVAYDDDCHRLGYGAGCYDRYFAAYPSGLKIGLAYAEQKRAFAHEKTDIPLDGILTPDGIIRRTV